jgi:hypothetical protein
MPGLNRKPQPAHIHLLADCHDIEVSAAGSMPQQLLRGNRLSLALCSGMAPGRLHWGRLLVCIRLTAGYVVICGACCVYGVPRSFQGWGGVGLGLVLALCVAVRLLHLPACTWMHSMHTQIWYRPRGYDQVPRL